MKLKNWQYAAFNQHRCCKYLQLTQSKSNLDHKFWSDLQSGSKQNPKKSVVPDPIPSKLSPMLISGGLSYFSIQIQSWIFKTQSKSILQKIFNLKPKTKWSQKNNKIQLLNNRNAAIPFHFYSVQVQPWSWISEKIQTILKPDPTQIEKMWNSRI